jgi:hypothetical protein
VGVKSDPNGAAFCFPQSSHGRGLHPDLPAIAQPFIYSSGSLELLPAIAPKPDPIEGAWLLPTGRLSLRQPVYLPDPTAMSNPNRNFRTLSIRSSMTLAVRKLANFNSFLRIEL